MSLFILLPPNCIVISQHGLVHPNTATTKPATTQKGDVDKGSKKGDVDEDLEKFLEKQIKAGGLGAGAIALLTTFGIAGIAVVGFIAYHYCKP